MKLFSISRNPENKISIKITCSFFQKHIRFARMFKYMREGNKISLIVQRYLRLRPGIERIFTALFFFIMFCHIAASIWYMQANLLETESWIDKDSYRTESDDNIGVRKCLYSYGYQRKRRKYSLETILRE